MSIRSVRGKVSLSKLIVLLFLVTLPLCLPSFALNPDSRISQYGHATWRLQDGVFRAEVTALAQTPDGYLWVGTRAGLLRFDGVRFEPWESIGGPAYPSPTVYSLYGAQDGSLWVGMNGRLIRWKDGVATATRGNFARINRIIQASDGAIWFSESRLPSDGPVCKVDGDQAHCLDRRDTTPITATNCVAANRPEGVLFCGSSDLGSWRNGRFEIVPTTLPKAANLPSSLSDVLVRPDGTVWLGMNRIGPGLGLQRRASTGWSPLIDHGYNSSTFQVDRLIQEENGTVWVATADAGIYRITGDHIDHFDSSMGLTGDTVNDLFKDHEGNLWVATSKGLDLFRDLKVTTLTKTEGLSSDSVQSVSSSPTGEIAAGTVSRLDQIPSSHLSPIHAVSGLPPGQITSALYDKAGHLWVGIDEELYVVDGARVKKIRYRDKALGVIAHIAESRNDVIWSDGFEGPVHTISKIVGGIVEEQFAAPEGAVHAIAAGVHDDLWLGTTAGALEHWEGGHLSVDIPGSRDRASRKPISSLLTREDGLLLAATPAGVFGWLDGVKKLLTTKNGLPCDSVNDIAEDADKNLWLYSDCGLFKLTPEQLRTWWLHPESSFAINLLDVFDGVAPGAPDFSPSNASSPDGRLWFANGSVLQSFDPRHIRTNDLPPPVHVESIVADGQLVPLTTTPNLAPNTRAIQINYTALSFVVPQKVHFRYKLDGWDKDWQEVGTRRQAFYTNLPPKTYVFHVIACNNDGVWNEVGDALSFNLRPAFYQTLWFKALVALLCVGVIVLLFTLRLRFMAFQMRERWRVRLTERERIARELHDTFLQGIQGVLLRVRTATRKVEAGSTVRVELEDALRQSNEVMVSGRSLVQDLRSSVRPQDLVTELEAVGREFQGLYPTAFETSVKGRVRVLNPHAEEELSKIGREAISNAFRHASASLIQVELEYGTKGLKLIVHDDGIGISREILIEGGRPGHWGLPGIRERVEKIQGNLRIESLPKEGTTLEVRIGARAAFRDPALRLPQWIGTSWRENRDG